MRRKGALPFIGCGSLGLLALVVAGCGSSTKTPATDGGTDTPVEVHADTGGGTDTRDTGTDRGNDLATDRTIDTGPGIDVSQSICSGVSPPHQLIADFADSNGFAFGTFGQDQVLGGTYVVSTGLDPEDFGGMSWHLTGTVHGRQDFFGLYWTCNAAANGGCTMDASQYAGIQFTIRGNVGPSNALNFTLGRKENDTPAENPPANCGTCVVPADAASHEAACHGPLTTVPVGTNVATVTYRWAQFTGGAPQASVDPHQLTGILWYFNDAPASDGGTADGSADGGGGPSYTVDLTIDDIQFLPF
jgi:hypothetical protein